MTVAPEFSTSRLLIRSLAKADPQEVVDYYKRNREHFAPTDPPQPEGFYTLEFWIERVGLAVEEFETDTALRLVLSSHDEPRRPIGTINFTQIFRGPFQACLLGYSMDGEKAGRGLMTEALAPAIDFVFGELNLHRIMANHLPENKSSARVLEKLGFRIEGVAQEYLYIAGAWRAHVLNALINPKWRHVFDT